MKLSNLEFNQKGKIEKVNCKESIKRRLLDLGLIKGTSIELAVVSPLKEPKAFCVRGTIIAMRKEETENIFITKL